jgi:serine/threonine protein kinase
MQSDDGLLDGMSRCVQLFACYANESIGSHQLYSLNFELSGGKMMYEQMARHVVNRQYRAPEVILCSGNYSQAIDVWSIGCYGQWLHASRIARIAQGACALLQFCFVHCMTLSQYQNPDSPNPRGHTPLFNEKSCFPLSPRKHTRVLVRTSLCRTAVLVQSHQAA